MKPWLPVLLLLSVLCLFPAAGTVAGPADSTGVDRETGRRTGAPLAEMMFYEAAEQAVEDGYARIIPESEEEGASGQAGEKKGRQEEPGPAAPVLESVEVVQ